MKTYLLKKEIVIAAPIEQVWKFFSDPANLERITPPYMNFRVTGQPDAQEIHSGMLIEYKVSPILNIPLKWVTLIQAVDPLKSFTDKQLKGPYTLWEHTHTFESVPGGTLMHDEVKYALPFGVLGAFAHWLFVYKQLQGIFSYREKVIKDLFG
jgi:ligand-binding SRPBCC domain-containing protein